MSQSNIEDLFDFELSDGPYIHCWTDGELTFLTVGYVTLTIPNKGFNELMGRLCEYHRAMNNRTEVV